MSCHACNVTCCHVSQEACCNVRPPCQILLNNLVASSEVPKPVAWFCGCLKPLRVSELLPKSRSILMSDFGIRGRFTSLVQLLLLLHNCRHWCGLNAGARSP